ncbi:MAG TPA: GNAT family N-acetyltransferase [Ktedonobacterales bacterium]|nr:GNAT family N-acetyltransferase [Ktedonobacterales bacterium]
MTTQSTPRSDEIVQGLDDPRLLDALEANTYAAYADYARNPASWMSDTPSMLRFISGLPMALFNGVAHAQLAPEDLDGQITAALRPFRERSAPMYWWVSPTTRPPDLVDHLLAQGLARSGGMPGMAIDLDRIGTPPDTSDGYTVAPVTSSEDAEDWALAAQLGNEAPPAFLLALREMVTRLSFGPEPRWTSFVGRVNARPVATSQLFTHGGVAGVYCVATVPDARRRGYGAEATRTALRHARDLGYRVGILQSSQMGLPIYEDMGFQTLMRFDLYTLPDGDAPESSE